MNINTNETSNRIYNTSILYYEKLEAILLAMDNVCRRKIVW